jgi:predicted DNA-binding protein YlxM (UPF0122 family)
MSHGTANFINIGLHKSELLKLSLIDGLSHQEISDLLGLPLGTVKSDLQRVKKKLKDYEKIVNKVFNWEDTNESLE